MTHAADQRSRDHEVVLTSARVELRAFRLDDAEALYEAADESRRELRRWLSWCQDDYAFGDTIEFLKGRGDALDAGDYGFAIIERGSGRFVGGTGINQLDRAARRANLGYWLRTSATGRGYATTSAVLVARWAFAALELERIEIVAALGNIASQRVAERAGAVREGLARRRLRVADVQHDAVVYSLVRGDVLPMTDENARPQIPS